MSERLDHMRQVPALTQKLTELTFALKKGTVEQTVLSLVEIRASQLNGCAFCLDMHIKQARLHGNSTTLSSGIVLSRSRVCKSMQCAQPLICDTRRKTR